MLSTKNPHQRHLFVIIVHYGSIALTEQAIMAIAANQVLPTQVIIIDQGPQSLAQLMQSPAAAQMPLVILPSQNVGYGAAANMGLGYLFTKIVNPDDIVVFMNNDVLVESTTLSAIHDWWQTHPEPALVGVTTSENNQELSGAGFVSRFTGRARLLPALSNQSVNYIHGAFVMASYRVWLKSGGWPEHYFLYWEDVLLSWRLRQRGIPLKVAHSVHIQHRTEKTPAQTDRQVYYLVRNGALFMTQETELLYRYVWRAFNWLRLHWHQWQSRQPIVIKALQDAQRGITGPQSV